MINSCVKNWEICRNVVSIEQWEKDHNGICLCALVHSKLLLSATMSHLSTADMVFNCNKWKLEMQRSKMKQKPRVSVPTSVESLKLVYLCFWMGMTWNNQKITLYFSHWLLCSLYIRSLSSLDRCFSQTAFTPTLTFSRLFKNELGWQQPDFTSLSN